jgi:light-regulated signal transduction histidine kinase (bacteriophytochrome)
MWDNPIELLPVSGQADRSSEDYPLIRGYESEHVRPPPMESNPLQTLLTESAADELSLRLNEPLRTSKADLVDIIFRGATVLSTMAAELGVVLRIQIRSDVVSAAVDEEKLRRAVNALVVHLLAVSQSGGWITIGLNALPRDGRRGYALRLTADSVVLPWKSNSELEEELNAQSELSLCRKIVEKHGGNLTADWQEDNKLTYSMWLPA